MSIARVLFPASARSDAPEPTTSGEARPPFPASARSDGPESTTSGEKP